MTPFGLRKRLKCHLDQAQRRLRRLRYGDDVIVVSGLPRSGTSMMMKMLEAAGYGIMTDEQRTADVDNPKGYYEDERVKDLENMDDKSWVAESRGKVLKVISFLLKDLPPDNSYRVLFMRRHVDEVLASQNKMIARLGTQDGTDDELMKQHYDRNLFQTRMLIKRSPNIVSLDVDYKQAIGDPMAVAEQVSDFLGGGLDVQAMAAVVDPSLYRNRK